MFRLRNTNGLLRVERSIGGGASWWTVPIDGEAAAASMGVRPAGGQALPIPAQMAYTLAVSELHLIIREEARLSLDRMELTRAAGFAHQELRRACA